MHIALALAVAHTCAFPLTSVSLVIAMMLAINFAVHIAIAVAHTAALPLPRKHASGVAVSAPCHLPPAAFQPQRAAKPCAHTSASEQRAHTSVSADKVLPAR